MQPINQVDLRGHIQRLREIFNRRFQSRHGDMHRLENVPDLGPLVYLRLAQNSSTVEVASDRGQHDTCAVMGDDGSKRILCSFFEAWKASGKEHFQFDKASMTFFLEFDEGETLTAKQMFRLEWENFLLQSPPNKAAYPHWQFDRWLTASDAQQLRSLRESFQAEDDQQEETVPAFESAEQHLPQESESGMRPNLSWFTRLHFPAIAPWSKIPITDLNDPNAAQSHRSTPDSVTELEKWIDSALQYLESELTAYALT